METKVDLQILELLTSRFCHDLISPIGAIGNGLELLEEGDPAMTADAIHLTMDSVRRASTMLQYFRAAFGTAGARESFRVADARRLAAALLEGGRHRLDWPPEAVEAEAPPGVARLLLNLVLLGVEALPSGGVVAPRLVAASPLSAEVSAIGAPARLSDEARAALLEAPDPASLTPKSVQPYLTARLAEALGGRPEAESLPDRLTLRVRFPAA